MLWVTGRLVSAIRGVDHGFFAGETVICIPVFLTRLSRVLIALCSALTAKMN